MVLKLSLDKPQVIYTLVFNQRGPTPDRLAVKAVSGELGSRGSRKKPARPSSPTRSRRKRRCKKLSPIHCL